MLKNAPGNRRLLVTLLLAGLLFPPALFVYACYQLFANASNGDMNVERLAVGLFLIAVALFGVVAWAVALMAVFGG